jgi:hypothetical protein
VVELRRDAAAGALEFVGRGVEDLEGQADDLFALDAEHGQELAVAVDHQPLTRQHQADGRELEGGAVIDDVDAQERCPAPRAAGKGLGDFCVAPT